jgi:hypothetical protein
MPLSVFSSGVARRFQTPGPARRATEETTWAVCERLLSQAYACAADQTAKPVGTFAGPTDLNVRSGEGHAVPQDTGDQGGGQN